MEPRNVTSPVSIDAIPNEGVRRPPSGVALEKHYSIGELAKLWELIKIPSVASSTRNPECYNFSHGESRFKRGYTTLRVPESVVQRVHRRLQGLA